jgi:LPXTG-motif cell wall-anchored protein
MSINDEKTPIQEPSTPSMNQNIVYILIGVIVLVGLTVMVVMIRKKKNSVNSGVNHDDNTQEPKMD